MAHGGIFDVKCVWRSGRLTLLVVAAIIVAGAAPAYRRADWRHWLDEDGDCQNTRQEVLIRDSKVLVLFRDERSCEVAWGEWEDAYTAEIINDPSQIDIDHLVALQDAHRSGGASWPKDQKAAYANDLSVRFHLVVTRAAVNRTKGSKGPDRWRPDRRDRQCQYAMAYGAIKAAHGLSASQAERAALRALLATC